MPETTDAPTTTRERTFTWEDPAPLLARAAAMTGLEQIQSMIAGQTPPPPIAKLVEFELVGVREGHIEVAFTPQEWQYNPLGVVHGGMAATILDTVLGICVHTTLEAGQGHTTVDLAVKYLRPMTAETGPVTAVGDVVHRGRRIATSEGRLTDGRGKLLATGTATLAIV